MDWQESTIDLITPDGLESITHESVMKVIDNSISSSIHVATVGQANGHEDTYVVAIENSLLGTTMELPMSGTKEAMIKEAENLLTIFSKYV